MKASLRYIGLDVHQASITLAVADAGRGPAEVLATILNDYQKLLQLLDNLGPKERLRLCYEAGPTGYGLARRLNELGYCCEVISPSLVPVQCGRRIKTDRRDACKLARFLRSGDLTAVTIPEAQTEAMRDLERARDDAKRAERVARQQLDKFMLRHGRIWRHEVSLCYESAGAASLPVFPSQCSFTQRGKKNQQILRLTCGERSAPRANPLMHPPICRKSKLTLHAALLLARLPPPRRSHADMSRYRFGFQFFST